MSDATAQLVDVTVVSTLPAAAEARPIPARGELIGRFLVVDTLGSGGMGVVLSAYDPQLNRRVAIKLLRRGERLDAPASLVREAQAMARLQHPNVISVHEVGSIDDTPYLVMEHVEGHTLRAWLEAEPRRWDQILELLVAAASGLAAAHRAGIIHR